MTIRIRFMVLLVGTFHVWIRTLYFMGPIVAGANVMEPLNHTFSNLLKIHAEELLKK